MGANMGKSADLYLYFGPKCSNNVLKVLKPYRKHLTALNTIKKTGNPLETTNILKKLKKDKKNQLSV